MLKSLQNLTIAKRLGVLNLGALIGVVLLTLFMLHSERTLIMDERKASVRQNVEVAHSLVNYYYTQSTSGKLPEADAKKQAMEALRTLRYSGNEYFWINDFTPVMIMHPFRPDLEGKDLSENKDPTGLRLFVEFARVAKASGADFVLYMWPKPGAEKPVLKVSYVKGFTPWGWIIGSGVYVDNVDATIQSRAITMCIFVAVLLAILLLLGVVIARGLMRQLGGEPTAASHLANEIAQGDLTATIDLKPGDSSSMLFAMRTMRDSISDIVGEVRQGTETINLAAGEIAAGNNDLSARTERQASSLEETAASMEELTATVKQNADNARQASQLAASASQVAAKGGAVVNEVVETMATVNSSSKKIVDIIGVIDGIAFQTNILALNAAVEAARAGEQGRGFAVVASEVRGLAQRSAGAAKEIKTLIHDSVESVEKSTALVDQAGATMTEVVTSVKRVTDIISEIAAASQEQSQGIDQINQAVTDMDTVTQQNAALVEESAAAASSMRTQAEKLTQLVSVFKL